MPRPLIVGIVNITEDSFSDGGRFLDARSAIAHAQRLAEGGADIIELGAAASNVAAGRVSPEEEISRLQPVLAALADSQTPLSIDTAQPTVQRWALHRGVTYVNDITGFPDSTVYSDLAAASCRLVVMHAVASDARAQPADLTRDEVAQRIDAFFTERIARLEQAGITRERLVLDPGMGLFLSTRAEASLHVLTGLARLKARFGLPVMVSVSRKSFLGEVTGRTVPGDRGAASLAAELYAATHGADFIRTHDPAPLADALAVTKALAGAEQQ